MGEHAQWGAECTDCHLGSKSEPEAGLPDHKACLRCHEGLEDAGRFALGGEFFTADGSPKWKVVCVLPPNVTFSHAKHAGFDCAECHGDIEQDDYSVGDLAAKFANCRRCHGRDEAAGRCSRCHATLEKSKRPHSHGSRWPRGHGMRVRDTGGLGVADRVCRQCHSPSYCVSCHKEEKPRDHTIFWVRAGHGLAADIDRERCLVCHAQDQCVRCHIDGAPPLTPSHFMYTLNDCMICISVDCPHKTRAGHTVLTTNCLLCHR